MPALLLAASLASAAPARIVSTAPSLTEILYALGLGDQVVGVTTYCTYPAEAQHKPKVGTFLQPDLERILALRPDLVLIVKNPVQLSAKIAALGLNPHEFDQDSVADIQESILRIGQLTGKQAEARRLRDSIQTRLDRIRNAVQNRPRRTALFLVGRSSGTLQGMVGAGPRTFIDELMALAGGKNVLAESPIQYPRTSLEQILAADPEFILDMGDFAHASGKPGQPEHEIRALWGKYSQLRAVRQNHVKVIGSDVFVRPGPRLVDAAVELQRILHPETLR